MKVSTFALIAIAASGTTGWDMPAKYLAGPMLSTLLFQSVGIHGYALPSYIRLSDELVLGRRHEGRQHGFRGDGTALEGNRNSTSDPNVPDSDNGRNGRGNRKGNTGPPSNAAPPIAPPPPNAQLPPPTNGTGPPPPPTAPGINGTSIDPNDVSGANNSTAPPPPPPANGTAAPPPPVLPGVNSTDTNPKNVNGGSNSTAPPPPPANGSPPVGPPGQNGTLTPPNNADEAKNGTALPGPQPELNATGSGSLPVNFPPPVPVDPGFVAGGFRHGAIKRSKFVSSRRSVNAYSVHS